MITAAAPAFSPVRASVTSAFEPSTGVKSSDPAATATCEHAAKVTI